MQIEVWNYTTVYVTTRNVRRSDGNGKRTDVSVYNRVSDLSARGLNLWSVTRVQDRGRKLMTSVWNLAKHI